MTAEGRVFLQGLSKNTNSGREFILNLLCQDNARIIVDESRNQAREIRLWNCCFIIIYYHGETRLASDHIIIPLGFLSFLSYFAPL